MSELRNNVRYVASLVLALLLSGCALTPPSNTEFTWLALHAIDTAQTVTIARNPECLWEDDPLAVMVYGTRHPSVSRVLTTNTIGAVLHWQASAWLEQRDSAAARITFYGISLLTTGAAVGNNLVIGLRPAAGHVCRDE